MPTPHPHTPPSLSAQRLREKDPVTTTIFLSNLKKVLSSNTIRTMLVLMGGGVGIFNTLGTQLGQMLCATGYGSKAAGAAAGSLIITGLVGSFSLGILAKRFRKQVEICKIAFSIACIGMIFLMVALRETNFFPGIMFGLILYGFFGLGAFPLTLELAVEVCRRLSKKHPFISMYDSKETYPVDPVFSEAFIHMSGQAQAVFFILLGNYMTWDPDKKILDAQVCKDLSGTQDSPGAVNPWDYTPYYYLIMTFGFLGGLGFIAFINPQFNRSNVDDKKQ